MKLNNFSFLKVVEETDNYIYFAPSIKNPEDFASNVFDYLFTDELLFKHFGYLCKMPFNPSDSNFLILYQNLKKFIDLELSEEFNEKVSDDIQAVLDYEKTYFEKGKIKKDKIGKIGELLLNIILENAFGFDVISDKFKLISSYNMSVYGIDTIHYSQKNKAILFGESKLTSNLKNGIVLIKESLKIYEKRILQEIGLRFAYDQIPILNIPTDEFETAVKSYYKVEDFIRLSGTKELWIPLFIAHGKDSNFKSILLELQSIPRTSILGMDTKYIVISMPLIDAEIFVKTITDKILWKSDALERKLKK